MHTRFEEMAAHYVREIRRMQPEGPYLLGGLCYSGVLAYEMGKQLVEQGQEVALLALFDAFPYGDRPGRIELERRKIADFLGRDLRGKTQWVGRRVRGARYKVSTRSRLALYRALVRMRMRPPRTLIDPTTIGSSAMRMYETPPAPLHVTLFRPSTTGDDVTPAPSRWVRLALGGVDVRPVVADGIKHQNMMLDPYAGILAGALEEAISEIAERGNEEAA
jgi:thioesterase domain-containing protein